MPRGKYQRNKITESLAAALSGLAQVDVQVEQTASKLLAIAKAQALTTLGAFDVALAAAYKENGWQVGSGRPAAATNGERRNVPHTVRTYVWEMRSAYREGLNVWEFASFHALRTARRARKETAQTPAPTPAPEPRGIIIPPEAEQDCQGVRISGTEPNGSLMHDTMLCFVRLPQEHRAMFGRQLARLLHRYQPMLPQTAPAPVARAA